MVLKPKPLARDNIGEIEIVSDNEQLELEKIFGKKPSDSKINLSECVKL